MSSCYHNIICAYAINILQLMPFHMGNKPLTSAGLHAQQIATVGDNGINVCVGKEWYRFPSSFYLPTTTQVTESYDGKSRIETVVRTRLQFVNSSFQGQLPQSFIEGNKARRDLTSLQQDGFNDINKGNPARFVDTSAQCHYVVDFDLSEERTGGVLVHGRSDNPDAQLQVCSFNIPPENSTKKNIFR